jgi:hypothetical protein
MNHIEPAADPQQPPQWIGPRAFHALHGGAGVDHHFGMRWGERREQRISLRRQPGDQSGLLYAYDPTWDEYAVLARDVPEPAVEAAFTQALDVDIHMDVLPFTELVRCHQILGTRITRSIHAVPEMLL